MTDTATGKPRRRRPAAERPALDTWPSPMSFPAPE
jgi:hypothetical protein